MTEEEFIAAVEDSLSKSNNWFWLTGMATRTGLTYMQQLGDDHMLFEEGSQHTVIATAKTLVPDLGDPVTQLLCLHVIRMVNGDDEIDRTVTDDGKFNYDSPAQMGLLDTDEANGTLALALMLAGEEPFVSDFLESTSSLDEEVPWEAMLDDTAKDVPFFGEDTSPGLVVAVPCKASRPF